MSGNYHFRNQAMSNFCRETPYCFSNQYKSDVFKISSGSLKNMKGGTVVESMISPDLNTKSLGYLKSIVGSVYGINTSLMSKNDCMRFLTSSKDY